MRLQMSSLLYFLLLSVILSCKKEADNDNRPPAANAGKDAFFSKPANGILVSGSGTDPDGFIVSYIWRNVSGPAGFQITNPTAPLTTIDLLEYGIYQLELKVTDDSGLYGVDTVAFIVDSTVGDPCLGCWDY